MLSPQIGHVSILLSPDIKSYYQKPLQPTFPTRHDLSDFGQFHGQEIEAFETFFLLTPRPFSTFEFASTACGSIRGQPMVFLFGVEWPSFLLPVALLLDQDIFDGLPVILAGMVIFGEIIQIMPTKTDFFPWRSIPFGF
mgnify:CR=1 FL=1